MDPRDTAYFRSRASVEEQRARAAATPAAARVHAALAAAYREKIGAEGSSRSRCALPLSTQHQASSPSETMLEQAFQSAADDREVHTARFFDHQ